MSVFAESYKSVVGMHETFGHRAPVSTLYICFGALASCSSATNDGYCDTMVLNSVFTKFGVLIIYLQLTKLVLFLGLYTLFKGLYFALSLAW